MYIYIYKKQLKPLSTGGRLLVAQAQPHALLRRSVWDPNISTSGARLRGCRIEVGLKSVEKP